MENIGRSDSSLGVLEIKRIPAFQDNYIFLIIHAESKTAAVVDPGEAQNVVAELKNRGLTLTHLFNTHHHADHVGGNKTLLAEFPNVQIFAGEHDQGRIPGATHWLADNSYVEFAGHLGQVMFVPGHTRGHICYYFPTSSQNGDLFIGDTLFGGGCGKLFEGTYAQMLSSLKKVRELPNSTRVWCAHEYTQKNLEVAVQLGEKNSQLEEYLGRVQGARKQNEPTIPLNLGIEKAANPFLRWDSAALQNALGTRNDLETFTFVRDFRDRF